MPRIVDGKITLDVTMIHPPGETAEPDSVENSSAFLSWWKGEAKRRSSPTPRWTGQDRVVCARLLGQHGYDRLQELATHFWRRHAGSLMSAEYDRHMLAFAAKIPIIEKELKEQAQ